MKRFRLTVPADQDLDGLWDYIAQDNVDAADRFIELLYDKFALLASNPRIGRPCDDLRPGLFRFPVGNYVIFYRVAPRHIEIARIVHGARNIQALFTKGESE